MNGRHGELDLLNRNGVDRLNGNHLARCPKACLWIIIIGNVSVLSDLPHHKFLALGSGIGLQIDALCVVKLSDLLSSLGVCVGGSARDGDGFGKLEYPTLLSVSAVSIGFVTVHRYNGVLRYRIALCRKDLKPHHVGLSMREGVGGLERLVAIIQIEINKRSCVFGGIGRGDLNGCKIANCGLGYRERDLGQHGGVDRLQLDLLIVNSEGGAAACGINGDVALFDEPFDKDLARRGICRGDVDVFIGFCLGDLLGARIVRVCRTARDGDGTLCFQITPMGAFVVVAVERLSVEGFHGFACEDRAVCRDHIKGDLIFGQRQIFIGGSERYVLGIDHNDHVLRPILFGLGGVDREVDVLTAHEIGKGKVHLLKRRCKDRHDRHALLAHIKVGFLMGGLVDRDIARDDLPIFENLSLGSLVGTEVDPLAASLGDLFGAVAVLVCLAACDGDRYGERKVITLV